MGKKAVSGIKLILILISILALVFTIKPAKAAPRTWTVDDDGPADFSKIQDALDAASSGDIIKVAPGIYYENVVVTKDDITLLGSGAYVTIIDGQDKHNVVYAYEVTSFEIQGFTIRNSSHLGDIPGSVGVHINPDYRWGGDFAIRRCRMQDNGCGAVIWNHAWGTIIIENNIISNNDYYGLEASYPLLGGVAIIRCNTIVCNGISGYRDWPHGDAGSRFLINNIIVSNNFYGISQHRDTPLYIAYNDVWNNSAGDYIDAYYGTPFTPSPGTGEISADPQFVDATKRDYHLRPSSLCIDAGDNDNAPSVDFEGKSRPVDGDSDDIPTVDMGAYEFAPPISIYTDKHSYSTGQTMNLGLNVTNPLGRAITVCIAVWAELPDGSPHIILHAHAVTLPKGFSYINPAYATFVLPNLAPGVYTWHAAFADPATHEILIEDTAEWQFI